MRILFLTVALCGFCLIPGLAQDQIVIPITEYNPDDTENPKWEALAFRGSDDTQYTLITDEEEPYIKAVSNNSGSGLLYSVDIDPKEYPIIEWRWKIDHVIEKGDLTKKEGDDYAARIYVTFDYDPSDLSFGDRLKYFAVKTFSKTKIPLRAINYIWGNKAEVGTIAPNAYTDWSYLHVVQSGNSKAGMWLTESQNVYEDYKASFGEEPPNISGIAILTDTDSTHEQTIGYFGQIILKAKPDSSSAEE